MRRNAGGAGDVSGDSGARWLAIAPSGAREEVDGGGVLVAREAGIYDLRPMDRDGGAPAPLQRAGAGRLPG